MIEEYCRGKGIDVSANHIINGAVHRYSAPDNLYLLRNEVGIEEYDYLYSRDVINSTKYYFILLYEWFLVVNPGGFLIIDFIGNDILKLEELKHFIKKIRLYRNKYQVVKEIYQDGRNYLILKKTGTIRRSEDEIDHWTFGIVTNGKRKGFIYKAINSILDLHVPFFEIILCGYFDDSLPESVKYIEFTEKDDKGWITKKKNLICEQAKYENIVIIHDRLFFDKSWFDGMKKYRNYFDVLSCRQIHWDGSRAGDWGCLGENWSEKNARRFTSMLEAGQMEYSDWAPNVSFGGGVSILKKSCWQEVKWDENRFWGEYEDVFLNLSQTAAGQLIRFNPYSLMISQTRSIVELGFMFEKNPLKLGKMKNQSVLWKILFHFLDFWRIKRNSSNHFLVFLKKRFKSLQNVKKSSNR